MVLSKLPVPGVLLIWIIIGYTAATEATKGDMHPYQKGNK